MSRDDEQDKKMSRMEKMLKVIHDREFNPIKRLYLIFGMLSGLSALMTLFWHIEVVQEPPETFGLSITVIVAALIGLATIVLYFLFNFLEGGKEDEIISR